MILGVDKLLKLVREKQLVEGLCERELTNPEGAGFDLRIGALYKISGKALLGIDKRSTPKMQKVAFYNPKKKTTFILQPGDYYVMETIEKVNTPANLLGLFRPRSTLYRSGIMLYTGNCSPGYCGPLFFGLANHGKAVFELELGARVAHLMFFEVKGNSNLYRGQWQGGRPTTKGKEKQV